jgi:hypothetical protein
LASQRIKEILSPVLEKSKVVRKLNKSLPGDTSLETVKQFSDTASPRPKIIPDKKQ